MLGLGAGYLLLVIIPAFLRLLLALLLCVSFDQAYIYYMLLFVYIYYIYIYMLLYVCSMYMYITYICIYIHIL